MERNDSEDIESDEGFAPYSPWSIPPAQRADDIPAQKPRSAENRDERVQIRCHGIHSWGPYPAGRVRLVRLVSGRFAMRNPHPEAGFKHELTTASPNRSNRLRAPNGMPRWWNW